MPNTTLYYGFTVTDDQLKKALQVTGLVCTDEVIKYHTSYHHSLREHLYKLHGVIKVERVFNDEDEAEWVIALERTNNHRNSKVRYDTVPALQQSIFGIESPRKLKWYYDARTGMLLFLQILGEC